MASSNEKKNTDKAQIHADPCTIKHLHTQTLWNTSYFGIQTRKNPLDLWVYQELIYRVQPDYIIEIGTYRGGSALALAHILDAIGKGEVLTIDLMTYTVPRIVYDHPRITLFEGDAVSDDIFLKIVDRIKSHHGFMTDRSSVMVIEDSAHTFKNTLAILERYSPLLSIGDYFIIEDTILGQKGLPNPPDQQGPDVAIDTFLQKNSSFEIDRTCEYLGLTFNPGGFLKKKADTQ